MANSQWTILLFLLLLILTRVVYSAFLPYFKYTRFWTRTIFVPVTVGIFE